MGAASASASAAALRAEEAYFEELDAATVVNTRLGWNYAVVLGALIAFFTIVNWTYRLGQRTNFLTTVTRPFRRFTKGYQIGSTTLFPGRGILLTVYYAVNIEMTFVRLNWNLGASCFAMRCGWMTLGECQLE
jgi:hypothetical protein